MPLQKVDFNFVLLQSIKKIATIMIAYTSDSISIVAYLDLLYFFVLKHTF